MRVAIGTAGVAWKCISIENMGAFTLQLTRATVRIFATVVVLTLKRLFGKLG